MTTELQQQQPFKVIIAGGSVAGLTLANMLERAGIDFEVLEKREVAPQLGQSILVLPCTNLIHRQLGLQSPTEQGAIPIGVREHWDDKGKLFCSSDELIQLARVQKQPVYFIDRKIYLQNIYDGLSAESKTKVRSQEGIESFTEHESGVTVRTDKGNVVEGSMLVGADGVHSAVRHLMAQAVQESDPKRAKILTSGFTTRYRILTCTSHNYFAGDPKRPFLEEGMTNNTYYPEHGVGGFTVAGVKGRIFWAIYIANDDEIPYPSRKYGQADIDEAMKKWGHLHLNPNYTFNDMYENLLGANMLSMEEGVLPTKWHSEGGRTVLMGDSVHKATANLGMGGNLCVDDACRLTNGLNKLLKEQQQPSAADLTKVFAAYEKAQRPRADFVCGASAVFGGFETMSKWYAKLIKFLFPLVPSSVKMRVFSTFDGGAPVLDFLPLPKDAAAA
ncbi:hypothetical protein BJ166DRAFT_542416 [Pestalotiopsis sp. NC0098]|nr:hypothetical protein BJ166DRAFT_542416 [Pestalotiopsis sp. NC0098]